MTPETQALRATVRRAVEAELRALCVEVDRTQQFSAQLWKRLTELGVTAIPFDPSHGGAGGSFADYVAAVEELGRAGILAANLPGTSVQVATVLLRFGSAEQITRHVPPIVRGEAIAAWAFTEPQTGSDPKQIRTTAEPDAEGGWVISGEKTFISLARQASVALVFARTGERLSAFLVGTDQPGWRPGPAPELMAGGGAGTGPLFLDGVRGEPVGEPGDGFRIMLAVEAEAKVAAAATCVGLAQQAVEVGARYALDRTHRGEPLGRKFPTIQALLGNMAATVDGARAHVHAVAAQVGSGTGDLPRATAAVRIVAARAAREVTSDLMQICGAYGFTRELGAERLYREGKFFDVLQGVVEIQRMIVARGVLDEARRGPLGR